MNDVSRTPRPQLSDSDINWIHDKRAEEYLVAKLTAKRVTWATVVAAVVGATFAMLEYFRGGHP